MADNKSAEDSYKEDLLAVLFYFRVSQLMITILRDNPHNREKEEYKTLARLSREVFHKLDWFCGLSDRILQDEYLRDQLALRDDKLANIANISSFIAGHKGDLSPEIDLITNGAARKEFFWMCWRDAQLGVADCFPNRAHFEQWYDRTFPNNISLPQKPINAATTV